MNIENKTDTIDERIENTKKLVGKFIEENDSLSSLGDYKDYIEKAINELKTTKEELKVDYLGKIKDEHTLLIPKQFDKWDEISKNWIEDIELKKEYEKSLIPKTITLRQARLYLLSIGLLDDLENIISQNRAYQIEWEYANQIEKESPLVKILGQTLNLDDTAIDNMFMEASKI